MDLVDEPEKVMKVILNYKRLRKRSLENIFLRKIKELRGNGKVKFRRKSVLIGRNVISLMVILQMEDGVWVFWVDNSFS